MKKETALKFYELEAFFFIFMNIVLVAVTSQIIKIDLHYMN